MAYGVESWLSLGLEVADNDPYLANIPNRPLELLFQLVQGVPAAPGAGHDKQRRVRVVNKT